MNDPRADSTGRAENRASRTASFATATAVVLSVVFGVAGCGVPIDDNPRAIGRSTISSETEELRQTPTTSNSPGARQVSVYFMRNESIAPVSFPVDGLPTLAEVLAFTVGEPPAGYNTAIPSGTAILSAQVNDDDAAIDLTPDINNISGQAQKQAYAQLAFTAFTFADVDTIRFSVDGNPVDAPTDNGNRELVRPGDYDDLRPAE